jgi:hypothetical protein
MNDEKLTELERAILSGEPRELGRKVLRCLDAALARAEAAEGRDSTQTVWVEHWKGECDRVCGKLFAAESEAAALRAEVERLRAGLVDPYITLAAWRDVLEAVQGRLAAAEALLCEQLALGPGTTSRGLRKRMQEFCSSSLAAGLNLNTIECPVCGGRFWRVTASPPAASAAPCTAEERAVLDAVRYTDWPAVQRHCRDACWLPPDLIALSDAALRWLAAPDATAG